MTSLENLNLEKLKEIEKVLKNSTIHTDLEVYNYIFEEMPQEKMQEIKRIIENLFRENYKELMIEHVQNRIKLLSIKQNQLFE